MPFGLFILLSTMWVDDPKDVGREAIQFSVFIWALFCCCFELGSIKVFKLLCLLCGASIFLSTVVAILVPSLGRHSGLEIVQYSHAGRWKGIFTHKNTLGPWAAICLFLYTVLLLDRSVSIVLGFTVLACSALCLLLSESVTSIVMFIFMISFYLFLNLRRIATPELFLVMVTSVLIFAVLIPPFVSDDLFQIFGRSSDLTGRTDLWSVAIDVFYEAPFLGQGYGLAGGKIFNGLALALISASTTGPDSGYLITILETGIIGIVLLFTPIIYCISCGFRQCTLSFKRNNVTQAALCIALGVLVLAFTEGTAFGPTSSMGSLCLTWFVILLVAQVESEKRKRAHYKEQNA
ncbi:O-antigen ligase family protein [Methylobacterium haplocladii]|nr:O-antigen ligase family protein [Methylobacterium haplocladii]